MNPACVKGSTRGPLNSRPGKEAFSGPPSQARRNRNHGISISVAIRPPLMTRHADFVEALIAQLPALRRYAIALAGNAGFADDLVQDSIEKALRQADQLREIQLLPRWLRRILHNLYVDEIRRRSGRGPQQDI